MKEPGTVIGSVVKALNVLSVIAERPQGASASEVADALGMPVPSAHHLLNTLAMEDALSKGADRRYRLGPRIGALSGAYYAQSVPDERLLSPLRELAQKTGETAYLTGWRSEEIEVLASAEGSHAVRVAGLKRGSQGNAHARASGKLLLATAPSALRELYLSRHELTPLTPNTIVDATELAAQLEVIAERGYAYDEEEFSKGVSCVAVAVTYDHLAIGAYTISAPTERFRANREALLEAGLAAAADATAPTARPRS
jgi:IclR family acetate operon transcriptional repressor